MCAKCIDQVNNKVEKLPDFIYISRMSVILILRQLVGLHWISDVESCWYALKNHNSILLPTGAKLFRDREGNLGVYSYKWDCSDIAPYMQYKLEE